MIVVDASVVVAAAVDAPDAGDWAREMLLESTAAPASMHAEVANALRRQELRGRLPDEVATEALAAVLALPIELWSFLPLAGRVWQLRRTVTAHDAWYVALAEVLEAPLATLDQRLVSAPGPRCAFLSPPAGGRRR